MGNFFNGCVFFKALPHRWTLLGVSFIIPVACTFFIANKHIAIIPSLNKPPYRCGLPENHLKLYTSVGPNPHVVIVFIKEKGIELDTQTVDIRGGECRTEPYLSSVNSRGQCPVLAITPDNHLTEITAICEYLEEKHPAPPLIGTTAEERAQTRMWVRRLDLSIVEPLANGFRASEGYEMFKDRYRVLPEAADGLKAIAQDNLAWLDNDMGDRKYICGDRFTLADIHLYCFLAFGAKVGQPLNPQFTKVGEWFQRISERESLKGK